MLYDDEIIGMVFLADKLYSAENKTSPVKMLPVWKIWYLKVSNRFKGE